MSEREIRIQQLFRAMQAAERNKDIDPVAYRKARIAYYRESQGEGWIGTEEARLGTEANQYTSRWKSQYTALQGLRSTHQTNLDIVRGAETRQIGFSDDFKYAVGELQRLIQKDNDSTLLIAREAYLRQVQHGPPDWAVYVMDALIVLLLIIAIWMLYERFGVRWTATSALINYQELKNTQKELAASLRQQLS